MALEIELIAQEELISLKDKRCTTCKIIKPLNEFGIRNGKYRNGSIYSICKVCTSKRQKVYREKEDSRLKSKRYREYIYRTKYGLSIEDYNNLLIKQKGLCAICMEKANTTNLMVDHNHVTNKVRGLLCNNCNLALGHFKDNILVLESAINYLKENK